MAAQNPVATPARVAEAPSRGGVPAVVQLCALGLALVGAVIYVGSPELDAPWILGDEHLFLVNNSDVTGAGRPEPAWLRWLGIFGHTHEDLYQPFTILTYAIEWSLWGDNRVFHVRLTDVLIHAVNALLLWAVLRAVLSRLRPTTDRMVTIVAWALACIWALHPMLVGAYAADMGRTHLLAATFTFLSVLCHLKSLEPGGWRWFVGAYAALLLAMLNKPMVGWVVVVFALEWALVGLRRALTAPRVYLVGLICAVFAALTLWTTKGSLLLEDSPLPLFGDPVARAALGLWIYLRNFIAPLGWLSSWYPPDIRTGWDHPLVWLGTLLTAGAAVVGLLAARNNRTRGVAVGLVWCWAMWLPVSGLVGARVLAAQDRYMYQPMVGLLLAIGVALTLWARPGTGAVARWRALAIATIAALLGAAAVPWDLKLCRQARSTLRRAQRSVELNHDDPRVTEFLAMAYSFGRNHPTPEDRLPNAPNPTVEFERTLAKAARLAEQNPQHFRDDHDRAAFRRRLSFQWWSLGKGYERLFEVGPRGGRETQRLLEQAQDAGIEYDKLLEHARRKYEQSLEQARRAHDFEPEAKLTWVRFAHAYRALERWEDARRAYEKLEQVMPDDAPDYALRYTEFADLLLRRFNDPSQALYKYRQALLSPQITPAAQRVAWLGAARCEVLAGSGRDGFELARQVLLVKPDNLEALRVVALYHLRSHRWEEAEVAYRLILQRAPRDYEALRGFHNVCAIKGSWREAALAWQDARQPEPDELVYRSWFVWAAACAAQDQAGDWADELLAVAPDNRFACLAEMLLAIRGGATAAALDWMNRAERGRPLPLAREFVRAEATLRLMLERGELPEEGNLVRAALLGKLGNAPLGRELVAQYLEAVPARPSRELAERILKEHLGGKSEP